LVGGRRWGEGEGEGALTETSSLGERRPEKLSKRLEELDVGGLDSLKGMVRSERET